MEDAGGVVFSEFMVWFFPEAHAEIEWERGFHTLTYGWLFCGLGAVTP